MATALGLMVGLAFGWLWVPAMLPVLGRTAPRHANFRGDLIPTSGGLLFLPAAVLAGLNVKGPSDLTCALVLLGFAALGAIDDRWGTTAHKGLRGHLRSLLAGRPSTGALKAIGGLVIASLALASHAGGWEIVPGVLLICLFANLLNLLDLRPVRTLKAFWLIAAALASGGSLVLGGLLGISAAYAAFEARRKVMLGDAGSNALGAALGFLLVGSLDPVRQVLVVSLLGAVHLWTERHSITEWIQRRAWARALDEWGLSEG